MKHVFVINPASGKMDHTEEIEQKFAPFSSDYDLEFYLTRGPGDATRFVHERCKRTAEPTRFYACGGDGTLNEVVEGLVGFAHASVSSYPCGSGNDFVKYYGGAARFLDPEKMLNGVEREIDLMRANGRVCVNMFNFGFDSVVCNTMIRVRRKPVIGGRHAYTTGVLYALLRGMQTKCRIDCDGETLADGKILLCTIGNGQYVGSRYKCSPRALDDDGLFEICSVRPVSRLTFVKLIGAYESGRHLDDPRFADIIAYRRARSVVVTAPEPLWVCIDGEMDRSARWELSCMPGAVRFSVPADAPVPGLNG